MHYVYRIVSDSGDVVYVGQTVNIAQRCAHHHQADVGDVIEYVHANSRSDGVKLESSLIDHYAPYRNAIPGSAKKATTSEVEKAVNSNWIFFKKFTRSRYKLLEQSKKKAEFDSIKVTEKDKLAIRARLEYSSYKGMTLVDYLDLHYQGNKRAFALDNNMTAQQVTPMINKGYYHVVDGYLVMMKTKLKIHEGE